ncbi:hypothetical protein OAF54_03100 [bacterium]|nr:hypothetical protein [bacterium]
MIGDFIDDIEYDEDPDIEEKDKQLIFGIKTNKKVKSIDIKLLIFSIIFIVIVGVSLYLNNPTKGNMILPVTISACIGVYIIFNQFK